MWTTFRRTDHDTFIIRKDTVTKGILYITLTKDSFMIHCDGEEGAELNLRENRGILLIGIVLNLLLVAKNDNSTLGTVGVTVLVLDGHQTHGWYRFATFMLDGTVVIQRDWFEHIKVMKAFIFFIIRIQPYRSVGIGWEKGSVQR